jgi:sporulation protein YlmC with PRC-barrel domain
MNTNKLILTAAVFYGLILTLPARAQETDASSKAADSPAGKPANSKETTATVHPHRISDQDLKKRVADVNKASKFIGMKVKNLQNENLGKIEDMAFDPETGRIAYAVVSVGGFLGINEKYIAVPLTALTPAPGADHLVLDADKQRLDRAPGFAKNKWPDLDTPAWGASAGYATRTAANAGVGRVGKSGQEQGSATVKSPEPAAPDDAKSAEKAQDKPEQFSGTITAVDKTERTVSVQGSGGEKQFKLDSGAQIRAGTENDAKLDDLKVGSQVNVEYKQDGDKLVARTIESPSANTDKDSENKSDKKDENK